MISASRQKYLRSLKLKKYRHSNGEFVAEGSKLIVDLLTGLLNVSKIHATEEVWTAIVEEHGRLNKFEDLVEFGKAKDLERLSLLKTSPGILATFKIPEASEPKRAKDKFALALDGINDPGNLGTLIRTADWFGIEEIFLGEGCADPYNPKTVQASMGSLGRLRLHTVQLEEEFEHWPKGSILAAEMEGTDPKKLKVPKGGLLVMGSESHGIKVPLPEGSNSLSIKKMGDAESLNVGVAAGILLHYLCS